MRSHGDRQGHPHHLPGPALHHPTVAELLAQQLGRKEDGAPHEQLSEREFQVFLKLAKGETAGDIAEALSLSVKTVSTYRTRLMEKMSLAPTAT
jgi:two-component system invasion response regulator UvrY